MIIPGRYRHYKGQEYEVLGVARHSETEEEFVVYRALYGEFGLWVRPLGMFEELVGAASDPESHHQVSAHDVSPVTVSSPASIDRPLSVSPTVPSQADWYGIPARTYTNPCRLILCSSPSVPSVHQVVLRGGCEGCTILFVGRQVQIKIAL
ncbi:MAG: DUF1653 domain-containing protein [Nitrospira sp.]|nr:DUF1653 domain-containing protein [Nitrospira sp.]